jgi:hypothetical protein
MNIRRTAAMLRWAAALTGVVVLAACADAPTPTSPVADAPRLGWIPPLSCANYQPNFTPCTVNGSVPGNGILELETLQVCKVWAPGVTPTDIQVRLQVVGVVPADTIITIGPNDGKNAAGQPIQCRKIWIALSNQPTDFATVTEVAPSSGYSTTYKVEQIYRVGAPNTATTIPAPFFGTGTSVAAVPLGGAQVNGALITFTNTPVYSVGDRVWDDANGDGVQDASETGINGATVTLYDNGGAEIASTTTATDGNYTFTNLAAGSYKVCVTAGVPSGYVQTYDLDGIVTADCASFTLGPSRTDVDFGYTLPPRYSIGDRVWTDANGDGVQDVGEAGITGATLTLYDAGNAVLGTTSTGTNGIYGFTNLLAGSYKVCVTAGVPSGYTQTFDLNGALDNCATVTVGPSITTVDFGYTPPRYTLGDRVWNDVNGDGVQDLGEAGITGVTLTLYDAGNAVLGTTNTGANGIYGFANLLAGSYKVCVTAGTPSGYTQTYDLNGALDNCATVTVGPSRTDVDFGYTPPRYSIGDRVWEDTNGNAIQDSGETGLNSVTVSLYSTDGSHTLLGTKVTSGDGNYTFTGLLAGTYEVCVTNGIPSGYTQTYDYTSPTNDDCAMATVGPSTVLIDFGYKAPTIILGGFGCSPGYWKTHNFPTGYAKTDLFSTIFAPTTRFPGKTMQDVVSQGGGGITALGRHAVSAYFNAVALGTKYEYTPAQVVAKFNAATTTAQINALITEFSNLEDVNGRACTNPTGK